MFNFLKKHREKLLLQKKTQEYIETARVAAHAVVAEQHEDLRLRSEENGWLLTYLENPEYHGILLSLELQYLFGYFEEYSKGYKYPTTPEDRTLVHIIDWLMHYRKYDLDDARGEVFSLRELKNEGDTLFESIAKRGREAYIGIEHADFFNILKAFNENTDMKA